MSWVRIDDAFDDNPKVEELSDAAFRLYVRALCWCSRHLTDGVLTTTVAKRRAPMKVIRELLDAKLWLEIDGGYQVHDFLTYNPSKAEVIEGRKVTALRAALRADAGLMRRVKARDQGLCRYCGASVNWLDKKGPGGGTYDHVVPLTKGGGNEDDNVVVACRRCNSRKLDRLLSECGLVLRQIPTSRLPEGYRSVSGKDSVSPPVPVPGGEIPLPPSEPSNPRPDPFMASMTGRRTQDDPGVIAVFEAWKLAHGFTGAKLRQPADARADVLFEAVTTHGVEDCLRVLEASKTDAMVTGKADEQGQEHRSVEYIFKPTTFDRLLREADKHQASKPLGAAEVMRRARLA